MLLQQYRRQNRRPQIAVIGDKGIGKHQLIEKMLDVETKVNDRDILSIDFFVSYIWIGDGQYQTIHYWVISLDQNQQLKRLPFVPQCDIYVIMFSLNQARSLFNALYTWFELCGQKRQAQYIFLGQDNGGERKCGTYQEIIKIMNNKIIRSTPNLEEIKLESVNLRKTIAYTEEFTDEQLPENVEYLEIKGNDHHPFKRLLIQQIQSSISQERQKLYSISAPISPNFMPTLQKSASQFVQKTDYSRSSFLTVSELQMEPPKNIEQVVKTIPIECQKPPPRTSMVPQGFSLEQSGYQEQKKEVFCCQLI